MTLAGAAANVFAEAIATTSAFAMSARGRASFGRGWIIEWLPKPTSIAPRRLTADSFFSIT